MGCRAAGQGRFMAEPTLATQGSTLWGHVEGSGRGAEWGLRESASSLA